MRYLKGTTLRSNHDNTTSILHHPTSHSLLPLSVRVVDPSLLAVMMYIVATIGSLVVTINQLTISLQVHLIHLTLTQRDSDILKLHLIQVPVAGFKGVLDIRHCKNLDLHMFLLILLIKEDMKMLITYVDKHLNKR